MFDEHISVCTGFDYPSQYNVQNLCKKRDLIKTKNYLEIIKNQITFTKDIKDFKSSYKKYIETINNLIDKIKSITNNEFKFKQIYYKKKKTQNKYAGNEDYVDFSQQFNNIDNINTDTFNPLETQTSEIVNPYKDTKNFLLLEKISIHIK